MQTFALSPCQSDDEPVYQDPPVYLAHAQAAAGATMSKRGRPPLWHAGHGPEEAMKELR